MEKDLHPAGLHDGAGHCCDRVADVELRQRRKLMGRPVQHPCDAHQLSAGGVILHLGRDIGREPHDKEVAKLVGPSHGVIVQVHRGDDVAGQDVVCENIHFVVSRLESHVVKRLLPIPNVDPVSHHIDGHDEGRELPVLALAQQPFLADIVEHEGVADASQQPPAKGLHGARNVANLGFVKQRQLPTVAHLVQPDEASLHLPGVELQALGGAHC
mmetsp:Transcript_21210/g.58918  ORF Transcript_21210/g.58918 Transcript_21210/m.58918 type:complete len:214 (-) Transcript_21210:2279-2920(-)